MRSKTLEYKRADVLKVLRTLNMLVVSLDRIGSATAGLDPGKQAHATGDFIIKWDVTRKLAAARRILSEPFSYSIGPDLMDELEREMQGVRYWSTKAPAPPRPRRRPTRRT